MGSKVLIPTPPYRNQALILGQSKMPKSFQWFRKVLQRFHFTRDSRNLSRGAVLNVELSGKKG